MTTPNELHEILKEEGYQPSYTLRVVSGVDTITCLICGFESFNPDDVDNRYCANCHIHHNDTNIRVRFDKVITPPKPSWFQFILNRFGIKL